MSSFTNDDLTPLIDIVNEHYNARSEVRFRVSQQTFWMIEYARQGKWYPRPRRQRSKARMSKKWREHDRI